MIRKSHCGDMSMLRRSSRNHSRLLIQSVHLFCCSRSLVSGVRCDVENCLMQLYVGTCHVVNAEISVAVAVPNYNPTDCEVRSVIRFLQANEILGYLAKRQALA